MLLDKRQIEHYLLYELLQLDALLNQSEIMLLQFGNLTQDTN